MAFPIRSKPLLICTRGGRRRREDGEWKGREDSELIYSRIPKLRTQASPLFSPSNKLPMDSLVTLTLKQIP